MWQVRYLVEEASANVNVTDRWGGAPLDDAMRSKHALVAAYLRGKGATSALARRRSVEFAR